MSKVRTKFDKEFKLSAVRMVTEDKLPKVEVARRLEVWTITEKLYRTQPGSYLRFHETIESHSRNEYFGWR